MPLKQPFIAMLVPRSDPSVNAGAIHLQTLWQPFDAKQFAQALFEE